MHILVIGAGGMLGAKLLARLGKEGKLGGKAIARVTRYDAVIPPAPPASDYPVETFVGDLSAAGEPEKLIAGKPDVIFHLAAIVSGEAEKDFEKGYRINLDATRILFEVIRKAGGGYKPKVIFTSSIAVFGAPFPEAIGDEFFTTPLTSYGTQKAIDELLLNDYSRRGFFDGVALRMPTVCVRPGKPNLAASGFFSNIIREPLAGMEAVLPVSDTVRHWHASPRAAVLFLIQAATMDTQKLGNRRTLTLPGLSCTVAEQIEALRRVAGNAVVKLIRREPDETIAKIVSGWPRNFDPRRALDLGFKAEGSFEDIIRVHMEDELAPCK
ncbi:MAG TPA: SDR family oxidoreductase [Aestuariivirga sp.]|nr:SDR family oxidoreductase [Hyphomicrobiales bacterium]HQY73308.1 SDR family oxidoreductase [Aestuariivirga sp.]